MALTLCRRASRRVRCGPAAGRGRRDRLDRRAREVRWAALEAQYPDWVYDMVAERLLAVVRPRPRPLMYAHPAGAESPTS